MNQYNFTTELILATKNFRDPWFWLPLGLNSLLAILMLLGNFNEITSVYINQLFASNNEISNNIWRFFNLISIGSIIIPLVFVFCFLHKDILLGLIVAIVISSLLTLTLKILVDVNSPALVLGQQINIIGPDITSWSFPSEQTVWVTASLGFLFFVFKSEWIRYSILVFILICAIARVVSGSHWVIDVAVGFFVGWLCAYGGFLFCLSIPIILPKSVLLAVGFIIFIIGLWVAFMGNGYFDTQIPQYIISTVICCAAFIFIYKLLHDTDSQEI